VSETIGYLNPNGERVRLVRATYAEGNLAIQAFDVDGVPYATLSVNFPAELLRDAGILDDPDAFYLKDWSENAGIALDLLRSGLVEPHPTIEPIRSGHVTARAYRLKENR
jgi:hypothetical protein